MATTDCPENATTFQLKHNSEWNVVLHKYTNINYYIINLFLQVFSA